MNDTVEASKNLASDFLDPNNPTMLKLLGLMFRKLTKAMVTLATPEETAQLVCILGATIESSPQLLANKAKVKVKDGDMLVAAMQLYGKVLGDLLRRAGAQVGSKEILAARDDQREEAIKVANIITQVVAFCIETADQMNIHFAE